MLAGFAFFILISLVTKKEDNERIEKFFDNMQRLTDAGVLEKDNKKPLAAQYNKDLILVDIPGWFKKERRNNFIKRYKEDWPGFILASLFVGLLVLIAWLIIFVKSDY